MNQAHLALVGVERPAQVLGSDFGSLVVPADRERVSRFIKHVTERHGQALEYSVMRRDGSVTDVSSDAVPLDRGPGTVAAALIVTRDLTEQRALEGKLRAAEHRHQQSVTGHAAERKRLEQALRDAAARIQHLGDDRKAWAKRVERALTEAHAQLQDLRANEQTPRTPGLFRTPVRVK